MAMRSKLGSSSNEVVQFGLIGKPVGTRIIWFFKSVFLRSSGGKSVRSAKFQSLLS